MSSNVGYCDCAIYIRTSTVEQNPFNQLQDCESIRPREEKMNTFVQYSLFEDKQSAWKDEKRDGFDRLHGLIARKRVRNLIVWDLDRLYRNRKRLIGFFEFCKIHGCKVHSFRQQWLNDLHDVPSPFNEIIFDLMLQIMGWMAEEESAKKSHRIKSAVRMRDGVTRSYKGNKWGRKGLSTQKKNRIIALHVERMLTYRKIAEAVDVSVGVVHKTLAEFKGRKDA